MFKWIGWIAKLRWFIIAGWLVLASLSFIALPSLQDIVRKTEQTFLPANAESIQAAQLLQNIHSSAGTLSNAIIVLSRESGLQDSDYIWMDHLLKEIDSRKVYLNITNVLSSRTQPDLAARLRSKDDTTQLAVVNLRYADFDDTTRITLNQLKQMLTDAPEGASALLTGSAPLSQDFQQSSENGLRRTEYLTVGLVLIILLFIFRSPITPMIPLLTIGFSFVIARGLIAVLSPFGIPVSHFTESFLIAVLFGAGTDYCILMIQRFREELQTDEQDQPLAAMSRTMNSVGRTILFSASTVFLAFLLIGLAEFGLYRSAFGVAIGMVVTVAAALTLTPAMLLVFGKAAFRSRNRANPIRLRKSRIWNRSAVLAAKRPGIVLLAAMICLTPLTLLFQGQRSFDDISEINPNLESIIGFRQVEKAFSSGEVFPVTVAVTSELSMRTKSGLAALEQASSELTRLDNVREVRSAVRPLGYKPKEFTVEGQIQGASLDHILDAIMNEQQALIEGLKDLAIGAAPLSQGMIGILPAIKQLQASLSKLLVAPLGGFNRTAHSSGAGTGHGDSNDTAAQTNEQALNYYISPDGLTTRIELILESNPYSGRSMDSIPVIMQNLQDGLNKTALMKPKVYATGVSAKYYELRDISYHDFVRTGLLVLLAIGILLMLLLRAIITPLFVLLSLGFNYLITMGIVEFIFVKVLGYSGLSWTVSFFIFLVIVALGVDYSIFLMARFKEEYRPGEVVRAMTTAMRTTGGVIGSAAFIMAGTFGILSFSGMDTLIQIGIGTFIGLLLYALLFMALIVPAFTFLLGETNWWPFHRKADKR